MFLGIDGGGTKTEFVLIDAAGRILGVHSEGSLYHLQVGLDGVAANLAKGSAAVLAAAGVDRDALDFVFLGLPAYGEDSALQGTLDALPGAILGHARYRCGNDMICSWAGSLGCEDGISVIAGTGSMAYGESGGLGARAGGWGELFGDEGSAYWIGRAGLTLYARMSDGRASRTLLYELFRRQFALADDLDLCGEVYGTMNSERSQVAQLARLVSEAALGGDWQARTIFGAAAGELVELVDAVWNALHVPRGETTRVSYSGGVFDSEELLLVPFKMALSARGARYQLSPPAFSPALGAALYAARCAMMPLGPDALARLAVESAQVSRPHPNRS
ncbi:N-acetylglucosamine kinase [Duganella hordei]|uniref:N-acetylglucosamine kinase n=1 Tax=Duganella hordei TaxID=2865934 RepID=UPI0030E894CE